MRAALVAAGAVLLLSRTASGQQDTLNPLKLSPITVTAEKRHAPPPAVSTIDVPAIVLHRTPATNPYDLIRRSAGIEIHEQGQGPGFASDAVIRGFTSDHSSDILFLLDGVPLNLPLHGHVEGYADWSAIPAIALTSVRVIHGPASPLYGDFAFGGVVEAFTSPDAASTIGSFTGSSYGDLELGLRTGRRASQGGFMLAGVGKRDEGWRQNSDYSLGTGILRGWRAFGSSRLEGGLLAYGSDFNSPGFVSVAQFNGDDVTAATDLTDGGTAHRIIGALRYLTLPSASTQLELSGWGQSVASTVFLNIPHDGLVQQTDEEDGRYAFGGQAQLTVKAGTDELTLGLSGRFDDTHYDLYDTQQRVRESHDTDIDGRHYTAGLYGRYRTLVGSRLFLDVGGRIDQVENRTFDNIAATGWQSGSSTQLSPKLGVRFLVGARTTLLASFSRGFRGAPGTVTAPDQAPMVAWAKELGFRFDDQGVVLQMALFRLDVDNERIMDPITREISGSGTSTRQGINAEVEFAASRQLRVSFEGTLNDAKITGTHSAPSPAVGRLAPISLSRFRHDEPLSPGDLVPGVARWVGRVGLEGDLSPSLTHHFTLRFSGPFTPIGEPMIRTQPYGIADIGATIHLPAIPGELDLTIQNVFNTDYPEIRASGFINPGNPRVIRVAFYFGESSSSQ